MGRQVDGGVGKLLYGVATRFAGSQERTALLLSYICSRKLTNEQQLTGSHNIIASFWVQKISPFKKVSKLCTTYS